MSLPAVTLKRIESVLKKEQLEYSAEEGEVFTGFINTNFCFQIVDDIDLLYISGFWRGATADRAVAERLKRAVREKNTDIFMPKLITQDSNDGMFRVGYEYSAPIGGGLTEDQLYGIVVAMFGTTLGVMGDLEAEFPELVTWKTEEEGK